MYNSRGFCVYRRSCYLVFNVVPRTTVVTHLFENKYQVGNYHQGTYHASSAYVPKVLINSALNLPSTNPPLLTTSNF